MKLQPNISAVTNPTEVHQQVQDRQLSGADFFRLQILKFCYRDPSDFQTVLIGLPDKCSWFSNDFFLTRYFTCSLFSPRFQSTWLLPLYSCFVFRTVTWNVSFLPFMIRVQVWRPRLQRIYNLRSCILYGISLYPIPEHGNFITQKPRISRGTPWLILLRDTTEGTACNKINKESIKRKVYRHRWRVQ